MAGVHDYFNFIKRGIGRATVHSSEDVRRGLISRQEGFELAKENDIRKPHALKYYKKITGLNEKDILNSLRKSRSISKYYQKLKNDNLLNFHKWKKLSSYLKKSKIILSKIY